MDIYQAHSLRKEDRKRLSNALRYLIDFPDTMKDVENPTQIIVDSSADDLDDCLDKIDFDDLARLVYELADRAVKAEKARNDVFEEIERLEKRIGKAQDALWGDF